VNHDPARNLLQRGAAGTHAGGHGGRVAPPGSADTGGWHTGVDSVAHAYGIPGCSNDVHDRNGRRRRIMIGIRRESKTVEGEPLRPVSSCPRANGTRQRQWLRGTLKACLAVVPLTKGCPAGTPPLPTTGFHPAIRPRVKIHLSRRMMIGQMIAPSARMMLLKPAGVQKTTFSDDR
jgi:hypothetical protein